MRTKSYFVVAVGLAAMLVAGGLFASNMGFKLNYPLTAPGTPPVDGTNTIGLPFNAQTNLANAENLLADINATAGSSAVVQVARYVKSLAGLEAYTSAGGTNFLLSACEGYRVQVSTPVNYIIVGSHDPSKVCQLTGPAAPPIDGTNTFSFPYHGIAVDADGLLQEINGQAGSSAVVQIASYFKPLAGLQAYTSAGGTNFPLVPGESYRVQVALDTPYQPDHY